MKKIIGIIILSILLSSTSFAGVKKGKGEVTMTANTVDFFIILIGVWDSVRRNHNAIKT